MFQLSCSASRMSKKEGKKDYISNLFYQVWVRPPWIIQSNDGLTLGFKPSVDQMILWVTGIEKPTEISVCSPQNTGGNV